MSHWYRDNGHTAADLAARARARALEAPATRWHTRTSRQRRLSMGTCASRHTICELNVDVDMFGESESGSVLGVAHRHMQPVSCRDRRVLAVSPEQGRSLYPAT